MLRNVASSFLRGIIARRMSRPNSPPRDPLIAIVGATGTGKSQLAVDLATRFNGEIINGDAMQMYRGVPIITNKIPESERKHVPHHLLGCIGLEEEPWTVGVFVRKALGIIKEIRSRGRLPILVGGTHYYTQSLLFHDSLAETESRRELEGIDGSLTNEEISSRYPILDESTEVILQRLREVDPVMADRWHPNDRRRIRRSLEIYCSTGRRASDIYEEQRQRHKALGKSLDDSSGEDSVDDAQKRNDTDEGVAVEDTGSLEADSRARFSTLILWTHTDPEDLKLRLDERVDQMVLNGLLSEVWSLNARFDEQSSKGIVVDKTRGIWISIGYKEFVPYICSIKAGDASDEAIKEGKQRAVEQTKTATRRYAKQQNRWIRIKFLHALRNARLEQKLFLLDTSDPSQWVPAVEQPAMDLAERFLAGNELPAPRTLSRAADDMLVSTKAYDLSDRRDLWVRTSCEVCGTTAVCDEDWTKHVRSRRHRRQVKRSMRPPRNSSS